MLTCSASPWPLVKVSSSSLIMATLVSHMSPLLWDRPPLASHTCPLVYSHTLPRLLNSRILL